MPPPFTKEEWIDLRERKVGDNALGHFDGAPAYKSQGLNQLRDSVPHSGPNKQYTKVTDHLDLEGNSFKAVAGTQSLDGWWTHGKKAAHGVNAKYPDKVWQHVREEQWHHWVGNDDRWTAVGKVLAWAASEGQ